MRFNGTQVVFNVLNRLKYPNEDIYDYSLISNWDSLVHKHIKSGYELESYMGEQEK